MGLALDVFQEKLDELIENPKLILKRSFMMNVFARFRRDLPPMQEYYKRIFRKDHKKMICKYTGATVVRLIEVVEEAFEPKNRTNKRCGKRVIELGTIAMKAILKELLDEKKATHKYLSHYGLPSSWKGCPDTVKRATLGLEATNDYSESTLGGTTHELTKFGRIGQHNAAAVNDNRRNKYWARSGMGKSKDKGEMDMIFTLWTRLCH